MSSTSVENLEETPKLKSEIDKEWRSYQNTQRLQAARQNIADQLSTWRLQFLTPPTSHGEPNPIVLPRAVSAWIGPLHSNLKLLQSRYLAELLEHEFRCLLLHSPYQAISPRLNQFSDISASDFDFISVQQPVDISETIMIKHLWRGFGGFIVVEDSLDWRVKLVGAASTQDKPSPKEPSCQRRIHIMGGFEIDCTLFATSTFPRGIDLLLNERFPAIRKFQERRFLRTSFRPQELELSHQDNESTLLRDNGLPTFDETFGLVEPGVTPPNIPEKPEGIHLSE